MAAVSIAMLMMEGVGVRSLKVGFPGTLGSREVGIEMSTSGVGTCAGADGTCATGAGTCAGGVY